MTLEHLGYLKQRKLIIAPSDGSEVNLHFTLTPKRGDTAPIPVGDSDPIEPVQDDPQPIVTDPIEPEGELYGFLSVSTDPWTSVHVDGKSYGNTPINKIRLKAGKHTVLMENRDFGKRKKIFVNIYRGQHLHIQENL